MAWQGQAPMRGRAAPPPRGAFYRSPYGVRSGPQPTATRLGLSQVFAHTQTPRVVSELILRYPRLSLSDDLVKVIHHWPTLSDQTVPLDVPIPFTTSPTYVIPATEEPMQEGSRHIARVMLLSANIEAPENGVAFQHIWRRLKFLVAKRAGGWVSALGGPWDPQDGVNPNDDLTLIKTAIRHVKSQAGIDLSRCLHWHKFMAFEYHRSNGTQDRTVLFLPDIWNHSGEEIKIYRQIKEQDVEAEIDEIVEVDEEVDEEEKVEDIAPDGSRFIKTVTKRVRKVTTKKIPKKINYHEKKVVLRSLLVSLGGLLEYVPEDILEESAEVSMFAEAFGEMVANGYGNKIVDALKNKRKADVMEAEETAKRQKIEEEATPDDEPPKTKTIVEVIEVANSQYLEAFQYFDIGPRPTGNIRRDALEGIIYSLGLDISEREVEDLLSCVGLPRNELAVLPPSLPYQKLAVNRSVSSREIPIEEAEAEEGNAEAAPEQPTITTNLADIEA